MMDDENQDALDQTDRDEHVYASVDRLSITRSFIRDFIKNGGNPHMSITAFKAGLDDE